MSEFTRERETGFPTGAAARKQLAAGKERKILSEASREVFATIVAVCNRILR